MARSLERLGGAGSELILDGGTVVEQNHGVVGTGGLQRLGGVLEMGQGKNKTERKPESIDHGDGRGENQSLNVGDGTEGKNTNDARSRHLLIFRRFQRPIQKPKTAVFTEAVSLSAGQDAPKEHTHPYLMTNTHRPSHTNCQN